MGMDPGSSCMGLMFDRPGADTESLVGGHRDWTVPGCANWQHEVDPVRLSNGINDCPSNT